MSWLRKGVGASLLVVLGTLAGVASIEAVVRLGAEHVPAGLRLLNQNFEAEVKWSESMAPDPYLGYHMRPNVDYSDELEGRTILSHMLPLDSTDVGVRDLGMSLTPVDGIAVGDSFTFCSTVAAEKCWLRLVAEQTGRQFVDLGVPGYSALQETRMLQRYGIPLRPRLILWAIFLNDFKEDVRFDRWSRNGKGEFLDWVRRQRMNSVTDWLERYSIVYRLGRRTLIAHGRDVHRWRGRDGDVRLSGAGWWRDIVDITEESNAWQLMRATMLEQKRLADEAGAPLVVLLFPFKEQTYWHVVRGFAKDRDRCDPDRPYRMVAQFAEAQGIPVYDLTDTFRAHAQQGEVLYLRDDAHWNEAGNLLAGRGVAAFLREAQLAAR